METALIALEAAGLLRDAAIVEAREVFQLMSVMVFTAAKAAVTAMHQAGCSVINAQVTADTITPVTPVTATAPVVKRQNVINTKLEKESSSSLL
ncbi:hypothetical protein AR687_18160 [Flavobacteriaceae bacterium CRH]|nr:hypothetical protein AR687_18160 [Flavobacteriaceae bacterium CRH]